MRDLEDRGNRNGMEPEEHEVQCYAYRANKLYAVKGSVTEYS